MIIMIHEPQSTLLPVTVLLCMIVYRNLIKKVCKMFMYFLLILVIKNKSIIL